MSIDGKKYYPCIVLINLFFIALMLNMNNISHAKNVSKLIGADEDKFSEDFITLLNQLPKNIEYNFPSEKMPKPTKREKGNPRGFKIGLLLNSLENVYEGEFKYSCGGKNIDKKKIVSREIAWVINVFKHDSSLKPGYLIVYLVQHDLIPRKFAKEFFFDFKDNLEWTTTIQNSLNVIYSLKLKKENEQAYKRLLKVLNDTMSEVHTE